MSKKSPVGHGAQRRHQDKDYQHQAGRKRQDLKSTPDQNQFRLLATPPSEDDAEDIGPPALPLNPPGMCGAPSGSAGAAHAISQPHEGQNNSQNSYEPKHRQFSTGTHVRKHKPRDSTAHHSRSAVKAVKQEKPSSRVKMEERSSAFYEELKESNAPLFASLVQQAEKADQKDWFTCELAATPPLGEMKHHDLSDFTVLRELYTVLGQASGFDQDVEIKLEFIKTFKMEGNNKKKFFYTLSCTSEKALENISSCAQLRYFKSYKISFAAPKESICGVRFQLPIDRNPEPFKSYSAAEWLQVAATQGLDPSLILDVQIGTRFTIGDPTVYTGMVDFYCKHEIEKYHGCDGALLNGVLVKQILNPPANVLLGRNPTPESAALIDNDLLYGQYYTTEPFQSPEITSNLMEDTVNAKLDPSNLGKTYIRAFIKPGHCKFCWGPYHSGDECFYKSVCRMCLKPKHELPYGGFHHSCHNLVEGTPKPDKSQTKKRPFSKLTPPPGAGYTPSESHLKRAKLLEEAKLTAQKRKAAELAADFAAEAAAAAAVAAAAVESQVTLLLLLLLLSAFTGPRPLKHTLIAGSLTIQRDTPTPSPRNPILYLKACGFVIINLNIYLIRPLIIKRIDSCISKHYGIVIGPSTHYNSDLG